jgi:uncharacterized membrane protein YiaA
MIRRMNRPSSAFIAAFWSALLLGAASCVIGLFNAQMLLNEKGDYPALLLGLSAPVSLQKEYA